MTTVHTDPILDGPVDRIPGETDLIEAAMRWHFDPQTGSRFWLGQADTLGFDPREDIHTVDDLARFPNIVDRLRYVPAGDLIPRGYAVQDGAVQDGAVQNGAVYGVYDSGGTTGPPKHVVFMMDWMERLLVRTDQEMDERHYPAAADWLALAPSGPHMYGAFVRETVRRRGRLGFTVDVDPRWVKKCIAAGRGEQASQYAEHVVAQARAVLETQDIAVLIATPPLLERLVRDEELRKLIADRVQVIEWGGAHMDPDTRYLLRTEVFPRARMVGRYGSTMILASAVERAGLAPDDPCIYDPFSPYITFRVVDPETGEPVPYGSRGRVVMNHVSKSAFLPNNLERDEATRIEPPPGQAGDSVADVAPVAVFGDSLVIEGVY
ncbi:AMP-binding protein [Frankia sp. QA3]|uniref:AMP-binding protein n=1 Tax=Frankia sp. QA3 TaxID=710111 RepID=UPI000269BD73|nr:AMP-binding protein [Frankia sp. QA3]EIV93031.1 coenzyme F390 synthetase [Frankia sp. QA3]